MHYRYDMTKPQDFYWIEDVRGTLDDIRQCCLEKPFSCDCPPLVNIPLENVVLDELHLMLRITGILYIWMKYYVSFHCSYSLTESSC